MPDLDTLDPSSRTPFDHLKPSPIDAPSPTGTNPTPRYLSRFLKDLPSRSTHDPSLDLPDDFDALSLPIFLAPSRSHRFHPSGRAPLSTGTTDKLANPETDSFLYIDHLLEALAVLGKLSWAIETIHQREPAEISNLIQSTIQEVEERSSDRKRQTMMVLFPTHSFLPPPPSLNGSRSKDDVFGSLTANPQSGDHEGRKTDENGETLRDLFWSVFSKLDAVLQGLRVVWEVTSRIEIVRTVFFKWSSLF